MPVYEYRCRGCTSRFERLLPMSADPVQPCTCGESADKVVTTVSFVGRSSVPSAPPAVPLRRGLASSLQGVGGTRQGVARAQRTEERLSRFEARNPEFADRKMPVVSHEGGRVVHATVKSDREEGGPP